MTSKLLLGVLLVEIASLLIIGQSSIAQIDTADRTPGNFDYYVLNLSWAPEFCATHSRSRSSGECDTQRHYGFIVHGLRPQNDDGTYPQACLSGVAVSHAIVDQMLPIMPDKGLIQHEWSEHGTCSGLAAVHYFPLIQKAFSEVKIPPEYRAPGEPLNTSPKEIEQSIASTNHAPLDAFRAPRAKCWQLRSV